MRFQTALLFSQLPFLLFAQSLPSEPTSTPSSTSIPVLSSSQPVLVAGVCGDNVLNVNEECDDGNILTSDGCSNACTFERCGDRTVQGGRGEQCDDGNSKNGDGCSGSCVLESNRSPLFGFSLSVAATLSGIPIGRLLDSQIPLLVSIGIGPTVGQLYMGDYRRAGIYTGLRAGALFVVGLGLSVLGSAFVGPNVGDGIPGNAFPGDGSALGGFLLVAGGLVAYPSLAIWDLAQQWSVYSNRPRYFSLVPSVGPLGKSAFGLSLRANF